MQQKIKTGVLSDAGFSLLILAYFCAICKVLSENKLKSCTVF